MKALDSSRALRRLAVLLAALVLAPAAPAQDETSPGAPGYALQPGDVLEVSVWREENMQRRVVVRPDGGISFPLVGDIEAAGRTVPQLRAEIATRLERYIPDPPVNVGLMEVAGNKVYVIGQVNRPGEYVASRYLDVMQALSVAGGMTAFASQNKIKILRRIGEEQIAIDFKYSQVEDGENLEQNIVLQAGDVVVVP